MRIFIRASFALLLSMASTPLAGCFAEIPEGEAAEEAYEEDQLDSAQAALCVMSAIPAYQTGSLVIDDDIWFFSGSDNYTDNCADHYVVEVTNEEPHGYEGFEISTWWNNNINNATDCTAARVGQTVYGYDPAAGLWEKLGDGLTAAGVWGWETDSIAGNRCKVEVVYLTSPNPMIFHLPYVNSGKYSKIRVYSKAWHNHFGGPSIHAVNVSLRKYTGF